MIIQDSTTNETIIKRGTQFVKQLSFWQAVSLIISGTIGAGVLGLPFAVAQIGILPGIVAMVSIGLLLMGVNMMVGWVSMQRDTPMQIVGLAAQYLGLPGKILASIAFYGLLFGVQLIYLVGMSEVLQTFFPWSQLGYATICWCVGSYLCYKGMKTVKTVELLLTLGIFAVVIYIIAMSAPNMTASAFSHVKWSEIFMPFGVLLFAFQGATTIPEAYSVIKNRKKDFFKAIAYAYMCIIALYVLFSVFVVGVTAENTTQIATIGLGNALGPSMHIIGNIFALLTMATSYILVGQSLKDSLTWDLNLNSKTGLLLCIVVPIVLFSIAPKSFITIIDIVGGIFAGSLILLMLLVYGQARTAHMSERLFQWVIWLLLVPVAFMFIVGVIITLPFFA